jgi:hypothetical protein
MNIVNFQPDKYAERVCTHKWAFATARTIALGAHLTQNAPPYFVRRDAMTLSKYNRQADHHAIMRWIVRPSQHTSATSPATIFSTVSAQCLLYGITMSGSSW